MHISIPFVKCLCCLVKHMFLLQTRQNIVFHQRSHVQYVHPELVFLTDISYVLYLFKGTLSWDPWCSAYETGAASVRNKQNLYVVVQQNSSKNKNISLENTSLQVEAAFIFLLLKKYLI